MKKHNFNAGPSILADEVIENAAKAVLDFNGSGLSVLSISHRSKEFDAVMEEADRLFRELLAIPDNYRIVYLGGGASTLFYEVAANFLGRKAGYVNTGVWSKKAIKEAKRYGEVEVVASSEDRNFTYIPKGFAVPADLDYLHITSNNTIYGTEYHEDISSPVPLIADMSSDILSRPVDVSKYAMIYGGAQKNLAPAGVAFAIIREDMLDRIVRDLPTMVSFRTHVENNSMFNTPPVFPIYVLMETLRWLKSIGGVGEIFRRNREKAALLYDEIDRNPRHGGEGGPFADEHLLRHGGRLRGAGPRVHGGRQGPRHRRHQGSPAGGRLPCVVLQRAAGRERPRAGGVHAGVRCETREITRGHGTRYACPGRLRHPHGRSEGVGL